MNISRNSPCPCGAKKPNGDPLKYKSCCLSKDEAQRKPVIDHALIVCMPTRGQVCYETMLARGQHLSDVKHVFLNLGRKPIVEARNILAAHALKVYEQPSLDFTAREWFVLWHDDDAWWTAGAVSALLPAFREYPDIDAIFGKFGGRVPFSTTYAYRDRTNSNSFPKAGIDCKHGDLVPIQRAGFHWVLMRLSLLKRIGENPFSIPEGGEVPEDFAFCDRACAIGAKLVLAEGAPIVHIDPRDGAAYMPGMPTMMMDQNSVRGFEQGHTTPTGERKTFEEREYGDDVKPIAERAKREASEKQREFEQRRTVTEGIA